ncbi:unnamed protein product [Absidia cylindrospora]
MDLAPGQSEPEWVTHLQESGILEEAFDFSKFVHGIAVMFDTRVALLPYWLAQMGDDLDELPVLPSQTPSVGKKAHHLQYDNKGKGRAASEDDDDNNRDAASAGLRQRPPQSSTTTDDNDTNERTSLLQQQNNASTSSYTTFPRLKEPEAREEPPTWAQRCINDLGTVMRHLFLGQESSVSSTAPPVVLPPGIKLPKKVITPLRVEPKVFFANERTYFSWMSFGTLLATFSIALFNAGDAVGKVSGVVYTWCLSLHCCMVWAFITVAGN